MRCKYYCDYCGESFDTAEECQKHEAAELAKKEKERERKSAEAFKAKVLKLTQDPNLAPDDYFEELVNLLTKSRASQTPKAKSVAVSTSDVDLATIGDNDFLSELSSVIDVLFGNKEEKPTDEKKSKIDIKTSYWIDGKKVDEKAFKEASKSFGLDCDTGFKGKNETIKSVIKGLF